VFRIAFVAFAQDEGAPRVNILQADAILRDQDQPNVQRLIGGVILGYRAAKLYCDSALRFQDGRFQTMGHVAL
jgi:1,4-dihydroxy-2-naphthoyl-CoA synthase